MNDSRDKSHFEKTNPSDGVMSLEGFVKSKEFADMYGHYLHQSVESIDIFNESLARMMAKYEANPGQNWPETVEGWRALLSGYLRNVRREVLRRLKRSFLSSDIDEMANQLVDFTDPEEDEILRNRYQQATSVVSRLSKEEKKTLVEMVSEEPREAASSTVRMRHMRLRKRLAKLLAEHPGTSTGASFPSEWDKLLAELPSSTATEPSATSATNSPEAADKKSSREV